MLPTLKHSSRQHYEYLLDSHLLPAFGAVRLADLSRESVQAFIADKLAACGGLGMENGEAPAYGARRDH